MAATGDKYTIRALDSVIGANSPELRSKILNQIPLDPRKIALAGVHVVSAIVSKDFSMGIAA